VARLAPIHDQEAPVSASETNPDRPESFLNDVVDPIGKVTRAIWWLVLIRGVCAVIFGILALFLPGVAFLSFVFVFAAYALVEGVVEIVHAVRVRHRDPRWGWLLALGIIAVVAAIVAFVFPAIAGLVGGTFILAMIAFYGVAMGIAGFPAAASMTDGGRKVLGYVVSVLSIVFGVILAIITLVAPFSAILTLIWVIGVWAIVTGVALILAAISARVQHHRRGSGTAAAAARG
jgi:uncharacterized membrane protein HdeD (DUF308 family)